jgi:hypothetical protein
MTFVTFLAHLTLVQVVFAESSICLDEKSNKKIFMGYCCFFYWNEIFSLALMQKKQKIKPAYFYTKNHRTNFPIAIPALRVSHSARGSLPVAKAKIFTVIF